MCVCICAHVYATHLAKLSRGRTRSTRDYRLKTDDRLNFKIDSSEISCACDVAPFKRSLFQICNPAALSLPPVREAHCLPGVIDEVCIAGDIPPLTT